MNQQNTYKEEVITVLLPSQTNTDHIFDDNRFEVVITHDREGNKIILLKSKLLKDKVEDNWTTTDYNDNGTTKRIKPGDIIFNS